MHNRADYLNQRNDALSKYGECNCVIESYSTSHRELIMRAESILDRNKHANIRFQDVTYMNIPTSLRVSRWEVLDYQSCPEVHPFITEHVGTSHFAIKLMAENNYFYVTCGLVFVEDDKGCH